MHSKVYGVPPAFHALVSWNKREQQCEQTARCGRRVCRVHYSFYHRRQPIMQTNIEFTPCGSYQYIGRLALFATFSKTKMRLWKQPKTKYCFICICHCEILVNKISSLRKRGNDHIESSRRSLSFHCFVWICSAFFNDLSESLISGDTWNLNGSVYVQKKISKRESSFGNVKKGHYLKKCHHHPCNKHEYEVVWHALALKCMFFPDIVSIL